MVCIGCVLCLPFGAAAQQVQDWHYEAGGASPVLQPRFYNEPRPETIDGQRHEAPWLQPNGPQVEANARSRPSSVMADTLRTYYFPRFKTVYARSDDTSQFRKTRYYTVERLRPEHPRKVYALTQAGDTIEKSIIYYQRRVGLLSTQPYYVTDSTSYRAVYDTNTRALKREEKMRRFFSSTLREDSSVRTIYTLGLNTTKELAINYYSSASSLKADSTVIYSFTNGVLRTRQSSSFTIIYNQGTDYVEKTSFNKSYNALTGAFQFGYGYKTKERSIATGGRGKWARSYNSSWNPMQGFVLSSASTTRWPDSSRRSDFTRSVTSYTTSSPYNVPLRFSISESRLRGDTSEIISYDSTTTGYSNYLRYISYNPSIYYYYTVSEFVDSLTLQRKSNKPAIITTIEYSDNWIPTEFPGVQFARVQVLGANTDTLTKEQTWYTYTADGKPQRLENWFRDRRNITQPLVGRYHGITIYEGPYDTYFLLSATKQLSNSKVLIAWPNPASAGGILHLNLPAGPATLPYTLRNVQGAIVHSGNLRGATNTSIVLPSHPGLYLLHVQGHQPLKLVVE